MPEKMSKILALCKYYMPIFEETFNKYDLPEELKIMAIIESAMNPTAISPAGAKGMWQFMYSTAKNYGLKIDSFVDERLDPVKSADAAARYLRDSYNIFGDWNLAISSYNCGAGNVSKAIKRSGGKRDFWSIYPYLPRETRGYVPAFVGAMYATTYYKEHGIVPEEIQLPAHIDTFEIHKMLHFKQINQVVGVPVDMLRNLNPQYTHDIIPGNEGTFILRIPYTYTNAFLDSEDSLYTYKAEDLFSTVNINKIKQNSPYGNGTRIVYRVRKGDYMGRIARRYHVSVSQLKKWNHLRSSNLKIGQKLVIYRKGAPSYSGSASQSSSSCTASTESDQSDDSYSSYTLYTVKDGDTLYSIAKRFKGISANNIMEYNKIGSDIHPGMKIRIPR
jgi:membrane-bound lytic murein transglycosylase D